MRKSGRRGLAVVLSAWMALSPSVMAQTAAPDTAQAVTQAFNIPPQPLAEALIQFGRQSGLQVSAESGVIRGLRTAGVDGTMTRDQALTVLLAGTGLVYRVTGSMVAIERPGAASGAVVLDPVQVQAYTVPAQAMIDNLPPPYAGGQVATGAQLGVLGNRGIMDAPFNVTGYTSQTIRDQQARSIADVVDNDPSVRNVFPRGSGIDQFTVRGFLTPNQDVLFGGLYGMTPSGSNVMAMEGVERLEVLKGPNTLLNGISPSGNIGGAINVVPKRATNAPITRFAGLYNMDSQFGGSVDLGRRFGSEKQLGIRFNGLYRSGNTPVANNYQETELATLGLDLRGDRIRVSADLGYQYHDNSAILRGVRVASGVQVPAAPILTNTYVPPWTFSQHKDAFVVARGEVDILENLTGYASFGTKYGWNRFLSGFPTVVNVNGNMTVPPFYSTTYVSNLTAETGLRGVLDTGPVRHQASLGFSGFWQDTGTVRSTPPVYNSNLYNPPFVAMPNLAGRPEVPTKTASSQFTSFSLVDTMSFAGDRVQFTAGLRLQSAQAENFNPTSGALTSSYSATALSPGFGLVVKPWSNVSVYANYMQALTQGVTAPAGAVNAGEIFPPYYSTQYEVGVKADFGKVTGTLSLFQIQQPVGILAPLSGVFSIDGEQRNRGVELNVFGEPFEGLRVLGGVMFLDAMQVNTAGGATNGLVAIGSPVTNLNFGVEWDTPFVRGFTLTGRTIYTSSQYLNATNTQSIPAWARIDAGARYAFPVLDKTVTVRAELLNVFGNNYWASTIGGTLIVGTPRTLLLSASVDF